MSPYFVSRCLGPLHPPVLLSLFPSLTSLDSSFLCSASTLLLVTRAKEVEAAIRAKDLGPALRWCEDNASRLRKLESTLEFRVRERAFLEMVRANRKEEVTHSSRPFPFACLLRAVFILSLSV